VRSNEKASGQQDILAAEALPVDYSLPVVEIYTQVAKYVFHGPTSHHVGRSENLTIKPGDSIWVVQGLDFALVLRPTDQGRYETCGPCFTAGIMEGEAYVPENIRVTTLE
jgi:hypothetical protein